MPSSGFRILRSTQKASEDDELIKVMQLVRLSLEECSSELMVPPIAWTPALHSLPL